MRVTDQAELVDVEYRSPEWYDARRDSIAASEVAALLGLSPWSSPFDLWWLKRTGDDSQPENDEMKRGRRLEPMVVEDFEQAHPELVIGKSVTVRNIERPWQVATPDALGIDGEEVVATIEAKTAFSRAEWGEPGTDDIPVHYRCQVLWQMDTLGVNVAYVPVWFGTQYAEYVVEYDEGDAKFLRDRAEAFLESVRADRQPDVDDSTATARRLKRLHPDVEDAEVEVAPYVVAQYHAAKRLRDAAESRMRLAENRLRAALGPARVATVDGRKVASRSVYDVKERTQTVRAHTVHRLTVTTQRSQERNLR
jgi:putative phage-type endonuclease